LISGELLTNGGGGGLPPGFFTRMNIVVNSIAPGAVGFFQVKINTLPSHVVLVVGLYGGTSSGSLSLQGSAVVNPLGGNGTPDGFFPIRQIVTSLPGGVLGYFQVKVWDSAYASYEAQFASGHGWDYSAFNNIFTMTPGTSIGYPQIYNGGGTTWAAVGNEDVNALLVNGVPEPSALALAALGAALMAYAGRLLANGEIVPQ